MTLSRIGIAARGISLAVVDRYFRCSTAGPLSAGGKPARAVVPVPQEVLLLKKNLLDFPTNSNRTKATLC
jgi:hypothetical protein